MSELVTATIPSTYLTEKLSSRESRSSKKPRKGWVKHVTGTDSSARGGLALRGDWLHPGEVRLPVGSVIVRCAYDGDWSVGSVSTDGGTLWWRSPETGDPVWLDGKTHTVTLCDEINRRIALAGSDRGIRDLLVESIESFRLRLARSTDPHPGALLAGLDAAIARLAAWDEAHDPAVPPLDNEPTADDRRVAELAVLDAALVLVADRQSGATLEMGPDDTLFRDLVAAVAHLRSL